MNATKIKQCTRLLVLLLGLATLPVFAQDKASKLDALVRQYVANGQFNGTVLVAEKGQVIFKKGYGMANMEWKIPNTPEDRKSVV